MFKSKKQSGFSLIEITIAIGLAGGLALIVTQLMKNMNDSAKSIEIKMQTLQFHSDLSNTLLSEQGCQNALGSTAVNFTTANSTSGQAISLTMPNGATYGTNTPVNGTDLMVKNVTLHNPIDQGVGPTGTRIYQAKIQYTLKTTKTRLGGNDFKKSLGSYYITVDDTTKDIVNCSSKLGIPYLCTKMNGVYDPATDECSVKPKKKDACELIGGTFDTVSEECNKFQYSDCGALAHGQRTTTCSGACSGRPGGYTYTTRLCLDGQLINIHTDSGRNYASCFIASTQVRMHDGSLKRIDEVEIGEKVLGENGQINTVIGIEIPNLGSRKLFSLNNDDNYFVTAEHPFKTKEG